MIDPDEHRVSYNVINVIKVRNVEDGLNILLKDTVGDTLWYQDFSKTRASLIHYLSGSGAVILSSLLFPDSSRSMESIYFLICNYNLKIIRN